MFAANWMPLCQIYLLLTGEQFKIPKTKFMDFLWFCCQNPIPCCIPIYPSSKWNYKEVRRLLPNAAFITILRDPVDCFESNFVYMGLQRDFRMDINQFAGSEVLHIIFFKEETTRRHFLEWHQPICWPFTSTSF